jgi:hypothetical protein
LSASRRPWLALACASALGLASRTSAAEPGAYGGVGPDPPLPLGPAADAIVDPRLRRIWREGKDRWFFATTLDLGWTYLRPRGTVGYGRPFDRFAALDANPIVSGNGAGGYGGLRLALPRVNVRVGARYVRSFNREYLAARPSYTRLDLTSTAGDPAQVITGEAEAEFSIPAGPGDIVGLGSISYVANVPKGQLVFEETLRVIVDPPLVWRARGGYLVRVGKSRWHSVGVVADVLNVPGRDDSTTVRAGPVVRVVLSRHLEVRGSFVLTWVSPDSLGLVGGDFTELGLRYRWATE